MGGTRCAQESACTPSSSSGGPISTTNTGQRIPLRRRAGYDAGAVRHLASARQGGIRRKMKDFAYGHKRICRRARAARRRSRRCCDASARAGMDHAAARLRDRRVKTVMLTKFRLRKTWGGHAHHVPRTTARDPHYEMLARNIRPTQHIAGSLDRLRHPRRDRDPGSATSVLPLRPRIAPTPAVLAVPPPSPASATSRRATSRPPELVDERGRSAARARHVPEMDQASTRRRGPLAAMSPRRRHGRPGSTGGEELLDLRHARDRVVELLIGIRVRQ